MLALGAVVPLASRRRGGAISTYGNTSTPAGTSDDEHRQGHRVGGHFQPLFVPVPWQPLPVPVHDFVVVL